MSPSPTCTLHELILRYVYCTNSSILLSGRLPLSVGLLLLPVPSDLPGLARVTDTGLVLFLSL